jgi:hypothetical protein
MLTLFLLTRFTKNPRNFKNGQFFSGARSTKTTELNTACTFTLDTLSLAHDREWDPLLEKNVPKQKQQPIALSRCQFSPTEACNRFNTYRRLHLAHWCCCTDHFFCIQSTWPAQIEDGRSRKKYTQVHLAVHVVFFKISNNYRSLSNFFEKSVYTEKKIEAQKSFLRVVQVWFCVSKELKSPKSYKSWQL